MIFTILHNEQFFFEQEIASIHYVARLVICVDTSVAHLAAAIGKKTWIAINYKPDFCWLIGREDSIWYESVRLFRQSLDYDWVSVMAEIEKYLQLYFPKQA